MRRAAKPGRPRASQSKQGLTTGDVAQHLKCSRTNVHRHRRDGKLPAVLDDDGHYRFQLSDVVELARRLRRPISSTARRVYDEFLKRGLRLTRKAILEIALATGSDPDTVASLWTKLDESVASVAETEEVKELARIARAYEDDIAKLAADRDRQRVGFASEEDDDPPPSSEL